MPKVLIMQTAATRWSLKDGRQIPTGFWGEEFAVPHAALVAAGVDVTIATPQGRPSVVDELSLRPEANGGDEEKVGRFRAYLEENAELLAHPARIEDVDIADYDAVLVPGGHGPMQDLAVNEDAGRILSGMLADEAKIVAALCHGSAAFFSAGDGESWAFAGRRMTAFTDEEETQVGRAEIAPWLLEERLRLSGAEFSSTAAWGSHVVVDGNLITGQNPESADATVKALLQSLGVAA